MSRLVAAQTFLMFAAWWLRRQRAEPPQPSTPSPETAAWPYAATAWEHAAAEADDSMGVAVVAHRSNTEYIHKAAAGVPGPFSPPLPLSLLQRAGVRPLPDPPLAAAAGLVVFA